MDFEEEVITLRFDGGITMEDYIHLKILINETFGDKYENIYLVEHDEKKLNTRSTNKEKEE